MNKWEKEVFESLLDSEATAIGELEKQYKNALNEINQKVKLYQADIDMLDAALNQDGLDESAKALLLSQKRSKIYQQQFQQALKDQVSGILDRMQGRNYSTIEGYLKSSYEDSYVGTLYDLVQQGIPVMTPINQASAMQSILLDSKVSEGYYARLGADINKLKKTISQEISRGIASSLSYSDIARNIDNVAKTGLSNAKRIARTEGHRIQNTAARDAALDARDHGADLVKVWDSTLDSKTRPSHRLVDGEIRELDEKFSNGLDRPGDPNGSAEEVINCRCAEVHKPRWDAEGGFAKVDNETGEILTFNSPKDYADFKEKYWSKENQQYMDFTSKMETKYGTKDYSKIIDQMSDSEYQKLKALEDASPMWKTSDVSKETSKVDLSSRRKERLANYRKRNNTDEQQAVDFKSMSIEEIKNYANSKLQTEFVSFDGVNGDYIRETVKSIDQFERMNGGTIDGLKVRYGGLPSNIVAKYDDKTNTLILKKSGSIKAFEQRQIEENARFKIKWKTEKPYHATTSYSGTIFHELGHAVDISTGQMLSKSLSRSEELDILSVKISNYAGTTGLVRVSKRSEAWAENFAAYMDNATTRKRVPKEIQDIIENYFKKLS